MTSANDRVLRDNIIPTLIQFTQESRDNEDFAGLIKAGLGTGGLHWTPSILGHSCGLGLGKTEPNWRCNNSKCMY